MTHFFVRVDRAYERVEVADIRYLEASKNYCKIWLAERHVVAPVSLKNMESRLPANEFFRIHRAYVISLRYLKGFDHLRVLLDGQELPIGDGRFNELKQAVVLLQTQPDGAANEVGKV
jgi:two-component system, LytTR family, response regulator